MSDISQILLTLPAVLLALMVHEIAHGFMAYRLGDPTAKMMGRLSLNPLRHLDPVGTICMVLFHFGWAKPVPINARYFKKPKRDMALTAIAGPLANLILAFFAFPCYILCLKLYASMVVNPEASAFLTRLIYYFFYFFLFLHQVNVGLAVFNLIPLPPLDGSRVLFAFLPTRYYFSIMRYERYIALGLMLFLLAGYRLGFLSTVSSLFTTGMQAVWQFIPLFR
ncbi:MAG: site-2 protease family protein [Clostridia bacterium]|nr:site-2 protease family protein [Clostridia bacterium]